MSSLAEQVPYDIMDGNKALACAADLHPPAARTDRGAQPVRGGIANRGPRDGLVLGDKDRRLLNEYQILNREWIAGAKQIMSLADEGLTM